jgi:dTDP-glucose 4,6-dehydratase/UDP-glucose 4-epimerase
VIDQYKYFSNFVGSFFDRHNEFRLLAEELGETSIFVTGGTGLFGQWVIALVDWMHQRKLAAPRLTVLARRDVLPELPFLTMHLGNIESFDFPNGNFDLLIHLAAPSARDTFNGMTDRDKLHQLYAGTSHVLDFTARQVSARSLFASSGAVYGGFDSQHLTPIKEDDRTAPLPSFDDTGLGLGKRVAEFLVMDRVRAGDVDAGIARAFSFVGPGLPTDLHYAVGNFVACAVRGQDIHIKGDGMPVRSYMNMGDAIWWLFKILLEGGRGDDFNVGSSDQITIAGLAELVRTLINPQIDVRIANVSNLSPGNPLNGFYVPDTKKISERLGLKQLTSLNTALRDYAEYIRMNGEAC